MRCGIQCRCRHGTEDQVVLYYLKGFALAWNMLTVVPLFRVHDFFKGINGISAMFYPFVGLILGGFLYGTYLLLVTVFPTVHSAVLLFVLWVVLTGALHLDGLSDTLDGLFVSKDKALEVMKESHVGGMGMIFGTVFLIFKTSSVIFLEEYAFLPLVLALSRLNAVIAIYSLPYISCGVSRFVKDELTLRLVLVSVGYVLVVALFMDAVWLFVFTIIFGVLMAKLFAKRYGGLNGDIYGFIIETSELFLLNLIIVVNG